MNVEVIHCTFLFKGVGPELEIIQVFLQSYISISGDILPQTCECNKVNCKYNQKDCYSPGKNENIYIGQCIEFRLSIVYIINKRQGLL